MAIPKQRGSGSFGGDGHRSNRSAFRRSGGSVKPPSWGCLLIVLLILVVPVALGVSALVV